MNIRIDALPKDLKDRVVEIGGDVGYYEELDECFYATFNHHEIKTHGDHVVITDDLTGGNLRISSVDFYAIAIV